MELSKHLLRRIAQRSGYTEQDVNTFLKIYFKALRWILVLGVPFRIKNLAVFNISKKRKELYESYETEVQKVMPYCSKGMTSDEIKYAHPEIVLKSFQVKYIKNRLNEFTES